MNGSIFQKCPCCGQYVNRLDFDYDEDTDTNICGLCLEKKELEGLTNAK